MRWRRRRRNSSSRRDTCQTERRTNLGRTDFEKKCSKDFNATCNNNSHVCIHSEKKNLSKAIARKRHVVKESFNRRFLRPHSVTPHCVSSDRRRTVSSKEERRERVLAHHECWQEEHNFAGGGEGGRQERGKGEARLLFLVRVTCRWGEEAHGWNSPNTFQFFPNPNSVFTLMGRW